MKIFDLVKKQISKYYYSIYLKIAKNKGPKLPLKHTKIPPTLLNMLEIIRFEGSIHIINKNEQVAQAVRNLNKAEILGFDTESRPSFTKGENFPISLLQLSTETDAYIFQLKDLELTKIFAILSNEKIKKVGLAINEDILKLQKLLHFEPHNFVDLANIAKGKGILQPGLQALTARYLGRRLSKNEQRSNWAKEHLSRRQLIYASTDAWICLEILPRILEDENIYSVKKTKTKKKSKKNKKRKK